MTIRTTRRPTGNREMQFLDPEDERYRSAAVQHLQRMLNGGTTIAREAMAIPFFVGEGQIPIIYFLGIKPGLYAPMFPAFLTDWNPKGLSVRVAFSPMLGSSGT